MVLYVPPDTSKLSCREIPSKLILDRWYGIYVEPTCPITTCYLHLNKKFMFWKMFKRLKFIKKIPCSLSPQFHQGFVLFMIFSCLAAEKAEEERRIWLWNAYCMPNWAVIVKFGLQWSFLKIIVYNFIYIAQMCYINCMILLFLGVIIWFEELFFEGVNWDGIMSFPFNRSQFSLSLLNGSHIVSFVTVGKMKGVLFFGKTEIKINWAYY